jgi:phage shock protein C
MAGNLFPSGFVLQHEGEDSMYCTKCGVELQEREIYCSQCGAATERAAQHTVAYEPKPLMRSIYDKKIAGVCAGVAHYLNVDVTIVRLVWLVLTFIPPGIGLIAYIIAWIVMPKEPERLNAANTAVYQA